MLAENIENNNIQIFYESVTSIENDLYRIASIRLMDIDDINDAIQNTIISAYKNFKKIKNYQYFKTWIIKILINECNKIYKQKVRGDKIVKNIVRDSELYNSNSHLINEIEDKLDFELALKNLTYEEKMVIVLKYNSQFSCSEISKILKLNINTVKSKLKRGKEKIKKYYEGGYSYNETTKK